MIAFEDILEMYASCVRQLSKRKISLNSDMLEMVAISAGNNLAYADDRKGLLDLKLDFWRNVECPPVREGLKYSTSQQFPDFILQSCKITLFPLPSLPQGINSHSYWIGFCVKR